MTSINQKNIFIQQNSINSLPHDLIIDILARVAAHSFMDFVNVKLCCRVWNELGEDDYVLKHLSLHKFKEWKIGESENEEYKRKSSWLVNKCADVGNVEALYRKGLVDYVRGKEEENAVEWLKKAANAGHHGAESVVATISIIWGGEEDRKTGRCRKAMMRKSKELREEAINAHRQLITAHMKVSEDKLRTALKQLEEMKIKLEQCRG